MLQPPHPSLTFPPNRHPLRLPLIGARPSAPHAADPVDYVWPIRRGIASESSVAGPMKSHQPDRGATTVWLWPRYSISIWAPGSERPHVAARRGDQDAPQSPALPLPSSCQRPSAPRSYSSRSMLAPSPFVSISAAARPPWVATASVTAYRPSHPPALIAESALSSSTPTSWQGMRATTFNRISAGARPTRQ